MLKPKLYQILLSCGRFGICKTRYLSFKRKIWRWGWHNLVTTCQVFGLMTKPLIRFLLPVSPPPKRKNSLGNMESSNPPKSITVPFLGGAHDSENDLDGSEDHRPNTIRALFSNSTHNVHRLWRTFDNSVMRPVFGGRGFVPVATTSPTGRSNSQWH